MSSSYMSLCRMSLTLVNFSGYSLGKKNTWGEIQKSFVRLLFQKKSCTPTFSSGQSSWSCQWKHIISSSVIHLSVGCWRVTAFPLRHDTWPHVSAPKVLVGSTQVPPRVLFHQTKHVMIPILTHTLSTALAGRWPWQTRIHTLQHNRHSSHWRNLRSPPRGMTPHRKHPAVTDTHTELTSLLENLYDCKSISHLCLQTWSCCVVSKSRTVKQ